MQEWITIGNTALIQKDPVKGNDPSNYRPITCLPSTWKILTGIIAEETYTFLERRSLLSEEQNGCRKGSRGTWDLLYIDRMLLQEFKKTSKSLGVSIEERCQKWKEKTFPGQFLSQTENETGNDRWSWLRNTKAIDFV